MSFLFDALKFIGILFVVLLIFNFIILVHEWGHFLAARWRGLKIEKFQIWMGKTIWKKTYNGVQYGLGTIPIGGFVQLPQMSPMEAIEGRSGENREVLPPIKPIDKIIVAFAGPLFSFLLAVFFACGVWIFGQPMPDEPVVGYTLPGMPASQPGNLKAGDRILEVDGEEVYRFTGLTHSVLWVVASGSEEEVKFKIQREGEAGPREVIVKAPYKEGELYKEWENDTSWLQKLYKRPPLRKVGIAPPLEAQIKGTMEHSPAAEAGFQKGDIILTVNGEKCYNPALAWVLAEKFPDKPIVTTVKRGDKTVELTMQPRMPEDDPRPEKARIALTGLEFEPIVRNEPLLIHPAPFQLIADCFGNTVATFQKLFTPGSPIGVSQMSGPVGIMNLYYNILQNDQWWRLVMFFSVVLNIGLAIFNMLPFPVLDGGHITMAVMEMVRGKPMNTRLLEFVQLLCVLGLLSFVLFVTLKDVGHIAESGEGKLPKFKPSAEAVPSPADPAAANP